MHSNSLIHVLAECMCLRTELPFTRASTDYSNGLNKISWVSEIANAKSCTWNRLVPAIKIYWAPPGWEAALLEKDPGLLMDIQLDASHWHHWRLRALWSKKRQQQTGVSPAGATTIVRGWRLRPVRSGQGSGACSTQRWNCCKEDLTAASQCLGRWLKMQWS